MIIDANPCGPRAHDPALRDARPPRPASDPHQVFCSVRERAEALLAELFGRMPADSIYERLAQRHRACDTARADVRALSPCPEVNRSLGRLVAIIQGEHSSPSFSSSPAHERALRTQLLRRITSSPELRARAHHLRSVAGLSEHALEQHWSEILLPRLRSFLPMSRPPAIGTLRVRALTACLAGFPYIDNYLQLTAAEIALLERPAIPLWLRTPERAALPRTLRQDFDRALAQLPAASALSTLWPERTIIVAGCGPLPITGLLMHALTGARVRLLDRDARALYAARTWVSELERLAILPPGAVRVADADVATLTFAPRTPSDVLLIAGLVDVDAKLQLARRWQQQPAPALLLLRSARGLCAELAYPPVPSHIVSHPALPFCGESVPQPLVEPGEHSALVHAPRAVLNTSELYRSLPLPAAGCHDLTPITHALEHARQKS